MNRFSIGTRARVRLGNPAGHTRIPGYLRGRCGEIIALAGSFNLPDEGARGVRSAIQPLYTVRFRAQEIWGADAPADVSVTADLWESYLEFAP